MFTAGGLLSPAPGLADGDPHRGVAGPVRPLLRPQPRPHVPWPDWAQAGGGALASRKETVSLDFPPQTFWGYLKFVPCHVPRPDWAQAGGPLASCKETVSLDSPPPSDLLRPLVICPLSCPTTRLTWSRGGGGELASLKGILQWEFFSSYFYLSNL